MNTKLRAFYETLGWDERGIPTKETLRRLDLGFLEKAVSKLE